MTHAYSQLYLDGVSCSVGSMLHYAVARYHFDGDDFLGRFIQSGVAEQIENGNPRYIAGKSGLELFLDVMEATDRGVSTAASQDTGTAENYDLSPDFFFFYSEDFWVGWLLAHYQWYSERSFKDILSVIPYEKLLKLYRTFREENVERSYEVMDTYFADIKS